MDVQLFSQSADLGQQRLLRLSVSRRRIVRQKFDQAPRPGALAPRVSRCDSFALIGGIEGKANQSVVSLLAAFEKRDPQVVVMQPRLVPFELFGSVFIMTSGFVHLVRAF